MTGRKHLGQKKGYVTSIFWFGDSGLRLQFPEIPASITACPPSALIYLYDHKNNLGTVLCHSQESWATWVWICIILNFFHRQYFESKMSSLHIFLSHDSTKGRWNNLSMIGKQKRSYEWYSIAPQLCSRPKPKERMLDGKHWQTPKLAPHLTSLQVVKIWLRVRFYSFLHRLNEWNAWCAY